MISNPDAKWPTGEIKFRTLLGDSGRVLSDGKTSWDHVAIDAASLWNEDLQPVRLALTPASGSPGSRDGASQVAWSDTVYGQSFGGAIAVAITWSSGGKVVESDILVDESRTWDSFPGPLTGHGFTNDLRRVLAHEFGHSLGLNHPDDAGQSVEAIMNSIASNVDEPAADDIAGILYLFPPESTKPTVAIKFPASGARLLDELVTVSGTATDNAFVERVVYQLNGSPATDADTINGAPSINWSAIATLRPGSNTFAVYSVDTSGNVSTTSSRSLFRIVSNVVQLLSVGAGSVSPNLDGRGLEIGRSYTVTAIPSAGHVFSNWTGGITSSSARLTFLMESNLQLQANFVTNPFAPAIGSFSGLFMETNEVRHESSGSLTFKLTDKGTYSGKLLLAGKSHSFSGAFDLAGRTTNQIKRSGTNLPLSLSLELGVGIGKPYQLTGSVSDENWTSQLRANRSVFNAATSPAPMAGAYTCIIAGTNDPAFGPAGDGYAAGKIDLAGGLKLNGKLADATSLSLKAVASPDAEWPLYLSLYSGKGSIIGWMTVTNDPVATWGTIHWFKPAATKGLHATGFTNQTVLLGSLHTPPVTKTNRVLNLTNGVVTFSSGNLAAPVDYTFTLSADNKVTSTNAGFSLSFTTASGLFKGSFTDPETLRKRAFSGVLLQNAGTGSGYFAGTNLSGWVLIEAAP
ncbi:MAG: matrixin family metalloprotease [Verrucomicrobia bacterium]|nr:matrixin family metalloprotease [Verrucomicrobiota bacterium]